MRLTPGLYCTVKICCFEVRYQESGTMLKLIQVHVLLIGLALPVPAELCEAITQLTRQLLSNCCQQVTPYLVLQLAALPPSAQQC